MQVKMFVLEPCETLICSAEPKVLKRVALPCESGAKSESKGNAKNNQKLSAPLLSLLGTAGAETAVVVARAAAASAGGAGGEQPPHTQLKGRMAEKAKHLIK